MGADVLELGGGILNNSNISIFEFLPPEMLTRFSQLITILKITGIVIIGYIVFLIIRWIFSIKRHRKISKIYRKVCEMDEKLDVLISGKKLEREEKKLEIRRHKIKKKQSLIKRFFKKKPSKSKKSKR